MSTSIQKLAYMLVFVMGLILIVGGIVTGKHGATVGGIIVAGVTTQQWLERSK